MKEGIILRTYFWPHGMLETIKLRECLFSTCVTDTEILPLVGGRNDMISDNLNSASFQHLSCLQEAVEKAENSGWAVGHTEYHAQENYIGVDALRVLTAKYDSHEFLEGGVIRYYQDTERLREGEETKLEVVTIPSGHEIGLHRGIFLASYISDSKEKRVKLHFEKGVSAFVELGESDSEAHDCFVEICKAIGKLQE